MPMAGRCVQAAAAALAVLAVAGCGGTKIDHAKVEKLLVGTAPTGGATVKSAKCPSGVEAKAGSTFDCDVKLSDGTSGTWTVHVVTSQGEVRASGADFTAAGPTPAPPRWAGPRTWRLPAAVDCA